MNQRGKLIGYLVVAKGMAMCVDEKQYNSPLYFGRNATLFPNRYRAQQAIRFTLLDTPSFEEWHGRLRLKRVHAFKRGTLRKLK